MEMVSQSVGYEVELDPGIAAMAFKAAVRAVTGATYAGLNLALAKKASLPIRHICGSSKGKQNDENAWSSPLRRDLWQA